MAILDRALAKAGDAVHHSRIEELMIPLWYVQLGWADQYGVSKDQGRAVLAQFERVIRANGIPTLPEGGPSSEVPIAYFHAVFDAAQ